MDEGLFACLLCGAVMIASGAVMLWLAGKSSARTLKRNMLAGVRTQAALTDDETWYAAQEAAAPRIRVASWGAIVSGIASVIGGIVVSALALTDTAASLLAVAPILLGAIWLLAWVMAGGTRGDRVARSILRERTRAANRRAGAASQREPRTP